MAHSLKRSRIDAYFKSRRNPGRWILIIAAAAAATYYAQTVATSVAPQSYQQQAQIVSALRVGGLIVIAVSIAILLAIRAFVPSDRQITDWARTDWSAVGGRARGKFSLDESEIIHDPIYFFYYDVEHALTHRGRDNVWRTTKLAATVINSTRSQFMIYLCRIDFTTGNFVYEETHEIFYQDVVSLATVAQARTVEMSSASDYDKYVAKKFPKSVVNGKLQTQDIERVEMRLVNGGGVPLAAHGGGGIVSTEGGLDTLAPDAAAIERLRRLIRDMRAHVADPTGRLDRR